jgi:hypothetical protein
METLKSFFRIFGVNTVVVTAMAVAATYVCHKYSYSEDFPMSLIGLAVLFPIVFSINGAYKRRETVLDQYPNLKGHGRAIFFASRDWIPDNDLKAQEDLKIILLNLMKSSKDFFQSHGKDAAEEEEAHANISALSKHIQEFRGRGLASGEVSRVNSYLSKMMVSFEN